MPTDPTLSTYAELYRRAIAAGMRGVLPKNHHIVEAPKGSGVLSLRWDMPHEFGPMYFHTPPIVALAACREWLREFCVEMDPLSAHAYRTPSEVILWAERIIMQAELNHANRA
jgi:hypothetical protein